MEDSFKLSAKQRRYRQPGAKLLPRDAYDAMRRCHYGFHSARELRRSDAAENKTMGYLEPADHQRLVRRLRDRLSARAVRRIDRLIAAGEGNLELALRWADQGRAACLRYVRALDEAWCIEQAIAADAAMLRNAY